jgi:hypothetical protein
MMQQMKHVIAVVVAILAGVLTSVLLSQISPTYTPANPTLPTTIGEGKWVLSWAYQTPWPGVKACRWAWWVDDYPTPLDHAQLVSGEYHDPLDVKLSAYGTSWLGYRMWISWVGWIITILTGFLLWPRAEKVQPDETGCYPQPRGPQVDLESDVC